ncbi:MAG: helix-turn-helix transcriptional regulator [Bacteroidetes bacterium]|nr:helix-turn-helix transcriptional regulator [Bacteroidota bacterium]
MRNRGISNVALADEIGKSEATVRNYQMRNTVPPLDIALKIASFLDIPAENLLDEITEDQVSQPQTANA